MDFVRAKKRLGQHFLIDNNISRKIVEQLSPDIDNIIEVGAGTGALTQFLVPAYLDKLHIIEIDRESVEYLSKAYPMLGDRLQHADFLKTNISSFEGTTSVIGNFPYNISSQIFFHVIEHKDKVVEVVGMVQKEMAERMASHEGNKNYGILSVLMQAWYDIEYLFTVHENVFNPPPKVKSAVIRMRRNEVTDLGCDERLFVKVVKQAFGQRRKTMRNSLSTLINEEISPNPIFNKRPEQLSVKQFIELTNLIATATQQD